MHDLAACIGDDLELDVPGAHDQLLKQYDVIPERAAGLAPRAFEGIGKRKPIRHDTHPLSAATSTGLDQQWKADALGLALQRRVILRIALVPRHNGNIMRDGEALCRDLGAQQVDRLGRWPDEDQASISASTREVRALGEKAITGMDRL